MKECKVVPKLTNLRYILKKFFTLVILLAVIDGSEGNKPSDKNLQDINNGTETVAATLNESKASNIKEIADKGSSFVGVKNNKNSPALNSFLRNVLQAQDQLKWIDQAVPRDGTKEVQGKSPRYSPESFKDAALRYRSKIRTKRGSGNGLDEFESWPTSSSRKYHDEENAGSRQQSIYLAKEDEEEEAEERGRDEKNEEEEEEGEEDEEMKVKRYVNPSDFDGELLSQNFRIKEGRSNLNEGSASAVDDLTLKRWARKEGLKVPGSWFESENREGNSERVNRMNDLSRNSERWIENSSRGDRDAVAGAQRKILENSVSEQPTLESLKRTVLELSRSLADSDRKMEELNENSARNRERHVEDLAGRKESRTKGEHERAMPTYVGSAEDRSNGIGKEMSGLDSSSLSSSWWEDPRSAAEMFDFKRRDDDEMDEEDDEEDSGNSEFDYMMQRVKREQDEDRTGARVRVYRRAGFGGSYPEVGEREKLYERRKRSKSEKDLGENMIAKNLETEGVNAVRLGSYDAGVREIRGAGLEDKIINVKNSDGEKVARARIAEVNVNENEHNSGGEDEKINKREEKNAGGYNPVEKETEGGTIEDSNLENVKTATLSVDDKRSASLRGSEEEYEQRLSVAADGETPLDESSSNKIKSELDGLLKNAAIERPAEKIANEKDGQGIEGEKIEERNAQSVEDTSEVIGNEVHNKISEESNERKKDEGNFTDHIAQNLNKQKKSNNEVNEAAIVNKEETNAAKENIGVLEKKTEDKHVEGESSEKEKPKPEGLTELTDKPTADSKINKNEDNSLEISGEKEKSNSEEQGQLNDKDTSNIIKLIEPRSESDIELPSHKEGKARYEEMKYKHEDGSYDEDKRLIRYSDKDNANYHSTLSNDRVVQAEVVKEKDQELRSDNHKDEKNEKIEVKDGEIKRDELTRKLLWLSSDRLESKEPTEIRDGRRDSAWDQKDGGKTGQRPANLLKNSREVLKFNKRSLMMADHRSMGNNAVYKRQKRRRVMRKGKKRSVKSYPENMEDDNAMEEVAREDKEDVNRSEARKRSLKKSTEYRREPDTVEELYQVKYEGFGQNDEAIKDPGVSNEEGENVSMESEIQAESSPLSGSSYKDEDRDPIRDRINMLIKQKLDDRGKGKQAHLKREAGEEVGNIEYYDYEGDVNGGKSEVGFSASDHDQPQNVTNQEISTSSTSEPSSTDSSEPIIKKDEIAEEERRQALEHEELNNRAPKEEFIPDPDATGTQKKVSREGDATMGREPSEGDQNQSKDEEIKNILRGAESSDDNNERRENEVKKSNYNQWLAQPIEANPVEEDMQNIPKDRFQDIGESREHNRPIENEKNDVLEDPLEYSVNVQRKINPDSLDDVLREKPNVKESEEEVMDEKSMRYDEQHRDNPGENEGRSNDEPITADQHWKYEGIKDKTQSEDDQKVNDEELENDHAVRPYNEKVSRRHWSYKDSARVGEENNAQESPLDSFSRHTDDQDEILENKSQSNDKKTAEQDAISQEARLIDESAEDSLPTMLDRSGPRNLAPGERTYLMIAPISGVKCPRETVRGENSSSSGSNYLALKTTDDMFKGGIEQSNPADEKLTEPDIMRKTTTEWRVINMGYDARAKPVTGRYPSSPSSVSFEDEEMMKPDSNLQYEFSEIGYQELGINPRDVAHESIVDPEEMAADFDDDLMPRLGRSLQSVSYSVDLLNDIERTGDGERPAEKYLENTQIGFERERGVSHRIHKRETRDLSKPSSSNYMKDEDHELDKENSNVGRKFVPNSSNSGKKIAEQNSPSNEEPNLTRINGNINGGKSIGKRSLEGETQLGHRGSNHEIDKDKRGLTNVEEWEMNAPNVQKQRTMTRLVKKEVDDLPEVERNDSEVKSIHGSREDKKIDSNFITEDKSSPDLESHDRETRSIKSKDGNVKPYVSPAGTRNKNQNARSLSGNRMRSKIRRKSKSYDKFQTKLNPFISSRGSNSRDNWNGDYTKIGDKSLEKLGDKKRNVFEKRSKSEHEKKKWNTKETLNRKRHPTQSSYSSSNRDQFWHPQHSHRKKTVNESATNHKHSSRELKKNHDGHQSKGVSSSEKANLKRAKNQKERTRFKDILREGHANGNREMIRIAGDGPRGSYSDSLGAPKAFDSGMQRQGEGRVLDENAEDGDNSRPDDEAEKNEQKKKFKVLLAADNMEDESQMDLALHGELAGKIVERIFDQVQKNDALKVALGPGLFRKHKSEDAVESDKIYRQGLDEDEVKHTEAMMRRVMELLGRLVLDEVQRKTCASLPPDMREFLQWMLGVEDEEKSSDQAPPLPLVHSQEPNHRQDDKFLFGGPLGHNENTDLDELNKKVRLLKGLINEYSSLTSKEKTKVQTVHDYLVKQLGLLMSYIDAKEAAGSEEKNVRLEGGNILQYQNAMPNLNDTVASQSTLPPLVNTPSILMLSNATFNGDHPHNSIIPYHSRSRRRDTRSSDHGVKKRAKKYKKHKKHKSHKHKNKKKHSHGKSPDKESPQYKKLIRKAALLRKKRADLYEDDWDPVDSGYEEPAIYTSSGKLANTVTKQRRSLSRDRKKPGEYDKTINPYFWADVLSGKSNEDEEFDEKMSSLGKNSASEEPHKETKQLTSPELNSFSNSMEKKQMNEKVFPGQQVKRDVLSASIALQPWINPKSDDSVSSEYLSKLTDELVHGAPVPPIYSATHDSEEKKRDVEAKDLQRSSKKRNLADQEVMLLSKREVWKAENEQQLEEVAFGKDMRGKWKDEERFKKLTEIDKKKMLKDRRARRRKREDEIKARSTIDNPWSEKSINKDKSVDKKIENVKETDESEVAAALRKENGVVKGGEDFAATGEKVNLISENLRNLSGIGDSENLINKIEILETLEKLRPVPPNTESINLIPDLTRVRDENNEADNESSKIVSPSENRDSEREKEAKEKDERLKKEEDGNSQGEEKVLKVSRIVLPWEKISNKISNDNGEKKISLKSRSTSNTPIDKRKTKRASSIVKEEIEESAILPLLEVSEQRQQQTQASKAEKDDQRDIADQTLGLESPLLIGLNTY